MQCNFTSCRKTGKIDPDALSPSEIMLARHIKTENYQAVVKGRAVYLTAEKKLT